MVWNAFDVMWRFNFWSTPGVHWFQIRFAQFNQPASRDPAKVPGKLWPESSSARLTFMFSPFSSFANMYPPRLPPTLSEMLNYELFHLLNTHVKVPGKVWPLECPPTNPTWRSSDCPLTRMGSQNMSHRHKHRQRVRPGTLVHGEWVRADNNGTLDQCDRNESQNSENRQR